MKENNYNLFKSFSKKPLIPNKDEIKKNNRSRSAKVRFAVRNDNSFFYPDEFKKKFINYFKLESLEI